MVNSEWTEQTLRLVSILGFSRLSSPSLSLPQGRGLSLQRNPDVCGIRGGSRSGGRGVWRPG